MVTFNEVLRANKIDPTQVALLRHAGTGLLGHTPYDLWRREDGSLDRYQSTQYPQQPLFELPYWASFVSTPTNETLFVGLYSAVKADPAEINWLCPMSGMPPGAQKGEAVDLYHLTPLDVLNEQRGLLRINWGDGPISWARYARRNEHAVVGEFDLEPIVDFDASPEGEATWRMQKAVERDHRLAKAALTKNFNPAIGKYRCESCDFSHADRGMFDAHHRHPMLAGPRMTRATDFTVLCPTCHRRAHRTDNKMLPLSLARLREWVDAGRP